MPFENGVMMQFFHWYTPGDGTLWDEAACARKELAAAGITRALAPPAYKGTGGGDDVGYGVYDMYDLGEFDQKGSVRTKYGTRQQYLAAVRGRCRRPACRSTPTWSSTTAWAPTRSRRSRATPFPPGRPARARRATRATSGPTPTSVPGPQEVALGFEWHWRHFDAVDYDDRQPDETNTVYLFEGKTFDDQVALENGNFAYLMGCDLDFERGGARRGHDWGKWYLDTTGVDGFRLDAVKHISAWFFPEWLDAMEKHAGKDLFVVGEYWAPDLDALHWYLDRLGGRMSVFDVPLHYNFHYASRERRQLRHAATARRHAGAERGPTQAVTFVDNHDSQPLQALESPVRAWFKPLAYAIILLRREGYPCVFYPDYYGAEYEDSGRDGQRHRVDPALAPLPHRHLPARPPAPRLRPAVRLLRPLEPHRLDAARRRRAPEGDGRAAERRAGGHEVDGGRASRTRGSPT